MITSTLCRAHPALQKERKQPAAAGWRKRGKRRKGEPTERRTTQREEREERAPCTARTHGGRRTDSGGTSRAQRAARRSGANSDPSRAGANKCVNRTIQIRRKSSTSYQTWYAEGRGVDRERWSGCAISRYRDGSKHQSGRTRHCRMVFTSGLRSAHTTPELLPFHYECLSHHQEERDM